MPIARAHGGGGAEGDVPPEKLENCVFLQWNYAIW